MTSEHRGDHQLALYRFADVAAWRTCAQKPSRDSLPSTVLSTHACEVGPWATLAWIGLYDSLEQLDGAMAAQSADMAYVEKLDKGGHLFRDGSASQILVQRIS